MSAYGSERNIPCTYPQIPEGYTRGLATQRELQLAGFHGGPEEEEITRAPGTPPLSEYMASGVGEVEIPMNTVLAESDSYVLLDPEGKIVATWDEGRWWTPEESDLFTAQLIEEMERES